MVKRLVVFVAVAAVVAGTAYAGAWFVPFILGCLAGGLRGVVPPWSSRGFVAQGLGEVVPRRAFPTVPMTVLAAVLGWAVPLWSMALAGIPVGATARAIAALAGLPPYAAVTIAVTLLLAALQVLTGAWLSRAVLPRRPLSGQR